jgi:hypothetical protein
MRIDIDLDVSEFDRDADTYIRKDWSDGIVAGLNRWARVTQLRLQTAMLRVFDRPVPFTAQGASFLPARNDGVRDPAVLITIMRQQAQWLELEIFGGERVAGDYATTSRGVLIPGPDAKVDRYGNLPRDFLSKALARKRVGWAPSRQQPGSLLLIEEIPGQSSKLLALLVPEIDYKPRFDFYGVVGESAAADLGPIIADELSRSLAAGD